MVTTCYNEWLQTWRCHEMPKFRCQTRVSWLRLPTGCHWITEFLRVAEVCHGGVLFFGELAFLQLRMHLVEVSDIALVVVVNAGPLQ